MQQAFHEQHGLQCGYCTPGMIMAASELLEQQPEPDRRGDPRRARRQSLPLHRLPEHRRRPCKRRPTERACEASDDDATVENAEPPRQVRARARCAGRTPRCSPARAATSTTSSCPGCCTSAFVRITAHARIVLDRHGRARRCRASSRSYYRATTSTARAAVPCASNPSAATIKQPERWPLARRQGALRRRAGRGGRRRRTASRGRDAADRRSSTTSRSGGGRRREGASRGRVRWSTTSAARNLCCTIAHATDGVDAAFARRPASSSTERIVNQRLDARGDRAARRRRALDAAAGELTLYTRPRSRTSCRRSSRSCRPPRARCRVIAPRSAAASARS